MLEWADTTIACTGDYMAGAYVDKPSQSPWESPIFWASTNQYHLVQVKEWLSSISTRTGGVVDPVIKIPLGDYGISRSTRIIYVWSLRLCASPRRQTQSPSWGPL
jgi:hypothetical protein